MQSAIEPVQIDIIAFRTYQTHFERRHVDHIKYQPNVCELLASEMRDFQSAIHERVLVKTRPHLDKGREVLVVESGSILRNLSRVTSQGLNRLANLSSADYLELFRGLESMQGRNIVAPADFASHVRRTWPICAPASPYNLIP